MPTRSISALRINHSPEGIEELGLFTQLPREPSLNVCGEGFNERTVRVTFKGLQYFVFREDLSEPNRLD